MVDDTELTILLPVKITAPVGVRWGSTQQRNTVDDQRRLIEAFDALPADKGGSRGLPHSANGARLHISEGTCDPRLAGLIGAFQRKHSLGSDGVADPAGGILIKLNQLLRVQQGGPSTPPAPRPAAPYVPPRGQRFKRPSAQPIPRQCSITNVNNSTVTVGLGAGGFFAFEVQDALGKRAEYVGIGGGGALGLDPTKLLAAFKSLPGGELLKAQGFGAWMAKFVLGTSAKWARPLLDALAGVQLSVSDWLALMGISSSPSATAGLLFAPKVVLAPLSAPAVERAMTLVERAVTGGGSHPLADQLRTALREARVPQLVPATVAQLPRAEGPRWHGLPTDFIGAFVVQNASAAALGSVEVGMLLISSRTPGVLDAFGVYGNLGLPILKLGAGITGQAMLVVDVVSEQSG